MDIPGENPNRASGRPRNRQSPSRNKSSICCRRSSPAAQIPLPGPSSNLRGYIQPCCDRSDPDQNGSPAYNSLLRSALVDHPRAQPEVSLDAPPLAPMASSTEPDPGYPVSTPARIALASHFSPRAFPQSATIVGYNDLAELRNPTGRISLDADPCQALQGRPQANAVTPRESQTLLPQSPPQAELADRDLAFHVIDRVRNPTSHSLQSWRSWHDVVVKQYKLDPYSEKPSTRGGHTTSLPWTLGSCEPYDQGLAKEAPPTHLNESEPIGSSFSSTENGDLEGRLLLDAVLDRLVFANKENCEGVGMFPTTSRFETASFNKRLATQITASAIRDPSETDYHSEGAIDDISTSCEWETTPNDLQQTSKLNTDFGLEQGGNQMAWADEFGTCNTFIRELDNTDIGSFGCMLMMFLLAKAAMIFLGFPSSGFGLNLRHSVILLGAGFPLGGFALWALGHLRKATIDGRTTRLDHAARRAFHHSGILLEVGFPLEPLASWGHGQLRKAGKSDHALRHAFSSKSTSKFFPGVSCQMGWNCAATSL